LLQQPFLLAFPVLQPSGLALAGGEWRARSFGVFSRTDCPPVDSACRLFERSVRDATQFRPKFSQHLSQFGFTRLALRFGSSMIAAEGLQKFDDLLRGLRVVDGGAHGTSWGEQKTGIID